MHNKMDRKMKGMSLIETISSTDLVRIPLRRFTSSESLKNTSLSGTQNHIANLVPSGSVRSSSPSRKSVSSNSSNTAKHEQASTTAAVVAASPPEKEKKRKEVSSSRVKKFHRHFSQVSKDEKLINYFSCALVSDILLQGHLYITSQHFAFYSNVFGYVTKVVIPTSSVTKISKEKTAKIIPNAVGVATADERHVFGSFISREAAYRLMCSVCPPMAPAEVLPKVPTDIEVSEEYSIEDDSSCSISGNESPPQTTANAVENGPPQQTLLRRSVGSSSLCLQKGSAVEMERFRHSDIPTTGKSAIVANIHCLDGINQSSVAAFYTNGKAFPLGSQLPCVAEATNTNIPVFPAGPIGSTATCEAAAKAANLTMIIAAGTGSCPTTCPSTSASSSSNFSSPTTTVIMAKKTPVLSYVRHIKSFVQNIQLRVKFPNELHVVYMGVLLAVVLAIFTVFLLYRILDIEARTSFYRTSASFNWHTGNDEDIFAEALRWQKDLQLKSTEEAQNILNKNLEQIAKVRRSLETLSMLIHDRKSVYPATSNADEGD